MPVDVEPLVDRHRDRRADAVSGGELLRRRVANAVEAANSRASACAAVGPTCRMDSATSTRQSGRCRACSRLSRSLRPFADSVPSFFVKNSERDNDSSVRWKMSPSSCSRPELSSAMPLRTPAPRCRTLRDRHVEHPLPQLRGARPRIGTADVDVGFLLPPARAALRAVGRHHELALAAVAQVDDWSDDLGDDVTGFAQTTVSPMRTPLRRTSFALCRVAIPTVEPRHAHRLHPAERGDSAGAADVDQDLEQLGRDFLGRVLERDRPPGRARRRAEAALQAISSTLTTTPSISCSTACRSRA